MSEQQKVLDSNEIEEILRTGTQISEARGHLDNIYSRELPRMYRDLIVEGRPFTEHDVDSARKWASHYLKSASEKMEEAQGIGKQYPDSKIIGEYLGDIERLFGLISEKASDEFINERVESCRGD
jgi:hypothetical protein